MKPKPKSFNLTDMGVMHNNLPYVLTRPSDGSVQVIGLGTSAWDALQDALDKLSNAGWDVDHLDTDCQFSKDRTVSLFDSFYQHRVSVNLTPQF